MDFSYTPEQEQFRTQVRSWLEKNSAELFGRGEMAGMASAGIMESRDDSRWALMKEYQIRTRSAASS